MCRCGGGMLKKPGKQGNEGRKEGNKEIKKKK